MFDKFAAGLEVKIVVGFKKSDPRAVKSPISPRDSARRRIDIFDANACF